eukprot:gnl/TRDRNA2_/TRDRNA2_30160_c0_seq1.p1 gnl/TRDRNA2_/TRDRNA2_30160_c0~~gnl/TRDRNA2_/TRDRNA2_30160_c0_seq1.p1  ORF type:complete len:347 (+),score=48.02 gnl/TRDRNA2_/TRDRNA2_30160_c0_seq1:58-1098(+)
MCTIILISLLALLNQGHASLIDWTHWASDLHRTQLLARPGQLATRPRGFRSSRLPLTLREPTRRPVHIPSSFREGTRWREKQTIRAVAVDSNAGLKAGLFALLPSRRFGAPSTNISMTEVQVQQIEQIASLLEARSPFAGVNFAESADAQKLLDGGWRLVYSDASEITRLEKLPLGFKLGEVYQPINVSTGRLENQARVRHSLLLASAMTRVIAKFWLPEPGGTNRAGVVNTGNRANVKFDRVIFSLRRLLVLPFFGLVKKVAVPNGTAERAGIVPSIDVTYLDDDLRISRGGDGSLFILQRPTGWWQPKPMLPLTALPDVNEEKSYNAATDILPAGEAKQEAGQA